MTLLVVLVELLIPWLKSEVLSSYGCLPSCWRTGPPLAKVCMARGAPPILPSLHIIDLSQHIGPLLRGRVQLFAENAKRMVDDHWSSGATFCKIRQRGVEDGRVCCKYSVIRKLSLPVGHLEAFCPYLTWRLSVDRVERPAAFQGFWRRNTESCFQSLWSFSQ